MSLRAFAQFYQGFIRFFVLNKGLNVLFSEAFGAFLDDTVCKVALLL